jgi:hypothetical protein
MLSLLIQHGKGFFTSIVILLSAIIIIQTNMTRLRVHKRCCKD